MTDTTGNTAGSTEETRRNMTDRAREAATDAAGTAREMAEDQTRRAKTVVAEEVGGVAHALRKAADDLREGSPQERTFAQIAETLADVSETIRGKDVGEMVHEANLVARRHPLTFLGGAALLGFAAVRFAKASGGQRRGSAPRRGYTTASSVPSSPGATPGGPAI